MRETLDPLNVISRAAWNARPPKITLEPMELPNLFVIVSHTGGYQCTTSEQCMSQVRAIQDEHMAQDSIQDDIGYSFVIGGDGRAYEARNWTTQGAHTRGKTGIQVCQLMKLHKVAFSHVMLMHSTQLLRTVCQLVPPPPVLSRYCKGEGGRQKWKVLSICQLVKIHKPAWWIVLKFSLKSAGYNRRSVCIALIGDFNYVQPPLKQLQALELLIEDGVRLNMLVPYYKLYGHNQFGKRYEPDMGEELFKIVLRSPHWTPKLIHTWMWTNPQLIPIAK